MSKGIITDCWGYGCAVLRNARRNIEKHNQVIRKHEEAVSLEKIMELPSWQNCLSYRSKAMALGRTYVIVALSKLDRRRLHIVLLYYVLEKTDEEINDILHMSSRSLVQYHRKAAIRQLQQWMGELEDEYDLL